MNTKKANRKSEKSIALLKNISGKKMTLGNVLWSIRECEKLTPVVFAKKLKISRQHLCDIERGRRAISTKAAADFAKKLGYSRIQFIRLAIQDELNKNGFHLDVEIHDQKDAA